MMIEVIAAVPTSRADRYVMNVCKAWGDRVEMDFRARQGVIQFDGAVATLTPRSDQLIITILANDETSIERLQNAVADRLVGAGREKGAVKFDWRRSSMLELHAL